MKTLQYHITPKPHHYHKTTCSCTLIKYYFQQW